MKGDEEDDLENNFDLLNIFFVLIEYNEDVEFVFVIDNFLLFICVVLVLFM